ncbi:MAG: SRPBCC family protein [Saprospiraceae bacterium]|jgi:ligand-binding SRPBCC domain-containing protein|nr:SRPBCC family protein [Lewinellaceae bacterium]
MAVYSLKYTLQLPISLDQAWEFFSSPQNLRAITPPHLGFEIKSDPEGLETTYPGQIICYTVKPVLGIPLFWMTEITHVREKAFFVDEQRVGPYAIWHHEHHFRAVPHGVEMTDLLHYKLPLGLLGRIAHRLFVRRQIEQIFQYRARVLEERFGKLPG